MGIFETDAGLEGVAHSLCSNSSQRHSIGLRSGLCAAIPHHTRSSMSLLNLLRALVCSHVGIGSGRPQIVPTKFRHCPK